MDDEEIRYWLALQAVPRIGGSKALKLLQRFALKTLFNTSALHLQSYGLDAEQQKVILSPDWHAIDKRLSWLSASPARHILTITDPRYPVALKNVASPPLLLYIEGDVTALSLPQIAMVGTRNPSYYGIRHANAFAAALVNSGLTITSGLAIGVDGESHKSALAAGGKTVAVLGSGLANVYPKRHRKLAEQILSQGAMVSEFMPEALPRPENFPRRNRIISGLALGVVVVEAALNSGSLITARYALEQGREVFAVPGAIDNPMSEGSHHLIQQGAKLVTNITDVTDELTFMTASTNFKQTEQLTLDTEPVPLLNQAILDSVGYEITTIDLIAERSKQAVSHVLTCLIELELDGWINAVPGGYVRSRRRG